MNLPSNTRRPPSPPPNWSLQTLSQKVRTLMARESWVESQEIKLRKNIIKRILRLKGRQKGKRIRSMTIIKTAMTTKCTQSP